MRDTVVFALYVWIFVSTIALVVQLFRRLVRRKSTPPAVHAKRLDPGRISQTEAPAAIDVTERSTRSTTPPSPAPAGRLVDIIDLEQPRPQPVATTPPAGTTSATVPATIAHATATRATATPTAATPTAATPTAATTISKPSLATLLAGVDLPHGLLPVAPQGQPSAGDTVYLFTQAAPPDVVGPAVADELERLGYELDPVDSATLLARRGEDLLTLTMVLDPAALSHNGARLFPLATAADVLVTIAVGPPR